MQNLITKRNKNITIQDYSELYHHLYLVPEVDASSSPGGLAGDEDGDGVNGRFPSSPICTGGNWFQKLAAGGAPGGLRSSPTATSG
ncbi:hypothetical protein LIER_44057 [Lithospermum erythrorhizon]|uniref:Uncharacterized protein n=1 Tax=Lithospermum erythrorhizon TaxID=34254 RepID=A0AAV3NRT6_LITER